jgi:hypothetical protein
MNLSSIRRALYFTQRTIGDYQAAQRGTLAQRLLRRQERRLIGRLLSRRGL